MTAANEADDDRWASGVLSRLTSIPFLVDGHVTPRVIRFCLEAGGESTPERTGALLVLVAGMLSHMSRRIEHDGDDIDEVIDGLHRSGRNLGIADFLAWEYVYSVLEYTLAEVATDGIEDP